ncbi:MAG TPA: three-Cys-motif partner protein TcmP [Stellaceae bacterium]|nr:three-Cys-motif partner protein TcmP [Stellaceae bacterium]
MNTYLDREQTQAKHFILRGYLRELAFKVLRGWDIAYIDGFSGPWESKTDDFSDTSFMIAISVLKEAQRIVEERTRSRREIKCFFSEKNLKAYQQMAAAVAPFHRPGEGFQIDTYHGEFVDAVDKIDTFIGRSFPLIFIDPTGWSEYPFTKIAPLFSSSKCEVLINFMYDHINRFLPHPDAKITGSLDPILGGPGWKGRLDPALTLGPAVEKLFRETLKTAGKFAYVVSTKIEKSTQERPHFFLAYGTKNRAGLIAFREIEYNALRAHARNRSAAITRKREKKSGGIDLFADHEADLRAASIDGVVNEQKALAREHLLKLLAERSQPFSRVVDTLLETYMLRETDVKNVCMDLAREGAIQRTWGTGNRKPSDDSAIALAVV